MKKQLLQLLGIAVILFQHHVSSFTPTRFASCHLITRVPKFSESLCPLSSSTSQNIEDDSFRLGISSQQQQKLMKRWATGLSLGLLGTLWIFGGNGIFTLGFLLASLVAQNEYYSMVKAAGKRYGIAPAVKTGTLSSLVCYVTAAFFPEYHELVLPVSASLLMIWLLVFNQKSASISEISTSLLGMFYIGYLPSFWVRLRALEDPSTTLFPLFLGRFKWLNIDTWTTGSIITWWTWTAIVFSDVGAYFIGCRLLEHNVSQ
jgi:CDP-diglyceride synthetase